MKEVDVYLQWRGVDRPVGVLRRQPGRRQEAVSFQYHDSWVGSADHFSIDASLTVGRGAFVPRLFQDCPLYLYCKHGRPVPYLI